MKRTVKSIGLAMIAMACYEYCFMATYVEVIASTATAAIVDRLGTSIIVGHLLTVMVTVMAPILIALFAYQVLDTSRSLKSGRVAAIPVIAALMAPMLLTLVVSTWPFSFLASTIAFVSMTTVVSVLLLYGLLCLDHERV